MAWAIDRLGRSLIDLLETIKHLEAVGVDLYLDQQNIDHIELAPLASLSMPSSPGCWSRPLAPLTPASR